jgi:ribosomal protein S18 acetylase RimI-like enzyme
MKFVPFQDPPHRAVCLELFDGHLGELFRPEARAGFRAFLDHLPGPYLVGIQEGEVVACGGVAFEDETHSLASVCWTIVHRDHQGRGLGRQLLHACVQEALADPLCTSVRLETVPGTVGFFTKLGFEVVETVADGYGPGQARVEMRLRDPRRRTS